jgi:hypothetical protein
VTATWGDVLANTQGVTHVRHIIYTVSGALADMWTGYPANLAGALDPDVFYWQPVNYPAAQFPMKPSIDAGVAEHARLMLLQSPEQTWAGAYYSEGSLVWDAILLRMQTPGDPLEPYLASCIGVVTFGNPGREAGHTIPGGIDPGGEGIVLPNNVNTPAFEWDFACGAKMAASPGNDLYTTCGTGETAQAAVDQRSVWELVYNVDLNSLLGSTSLAAEIFGLLANPAVGGVAAVEATIGALDFFAVEGLTPHTSYQVVQPIPGDPRDCCTIAFDYISAQGASIPARTAA